MLGPAEEVLAVFHRVVEVLLPWNSEASEFKLQFPPALPTHRDHPQPDAPTLHKGLFLKGPTGFGLRWNPVLKFTVYKGETWPPGGASRKGNGKQDPKLK